MAYNNIMQVAHTVNTESELAPYIWQRWIAPSLWPQDDPDTKAAGFDADPAVGVTGWVVPKSGPKSRMRVSRFEPEKTFYLQTKLPLAVMSFEHNMVRDGADFTMTHRLVFSGPLGGLFARLIGKKIGAGFPGVMESIVTHARSMKDA